MLTVTIPDYEGFNEETQEFVNVKGATIQLEHSLISLKKWEQKWHIPFLDNTKKKTLEHTIDYIRCMTINPNVDPNVYNYIPNDVIKQITDYIKDPMTATWFSNNSNKKGASSRGMVLTAEVIYYQMLSRGIPIELQKWHLNSLLTLIRVFDSMGSTNKMGTAEWASQRSALNAARRAKLNTKG